MEIKQDAIVPRDIVRNKVVIASIQLVFVGIDGTISKSLNHTIMYI